MTELSPPQKPKQPFNANQREAISRIALELEPDSSIQEVKTVRAKLNLTLVRDFAIWQSPSPEESAVDIYERWEILLREHEMSPDSSFKELVFMHDLIRSHHFNGAMLDLACEKLKCGPLKSWSEVDAYLTKELELVKGEELALLVKFRLTEQKLRNIQDDLKTGLLLEKILEIGATA